MKCDFLDWNCSIAHRRSGALRELTHEPLAINNAEALAPVQSAVRDGGTLVAASYRYRADPNEIGKMPAHVHALPARRTFNDRAATSAVTARRTCGDRTANAQQARSKRAASAQQARSDQRCMKHVCCIEIHTDMQSHTYRYALPSLLLRNAYVNVCACMSAVYSRHTGTYALDTAPMIR